MFSFEGFSLMLLNFLRVPPGSSLRKYSGHGSERDWADEAILNDDKINTMVDITTDDVCIGASPLYLSCDDNTPNRIKSVADSILEEFNSVVKWVAVDLLKRGFSVYETKVVKGKFKLIPVVDNLSFYMTKDKEIIVYRENKQDNSGRSEEKMNLTKCIMFLSYDKESLVSLDNLGGMGQIDSSILFGIDPSPIQLKHCRQVAKELAITKNSILRWRQQMSRLIRLVTVDVGMSQGDTQQNLIDSISSAVNANSMDLQVISDVQQFDDNIPIVPNRRGAGKPEIVESIPDANIKELADLDKLNGELDLIMRFPKTYADFSQSLGETAASTIRGDVRYSRMLDTCRSKIADTINTYLGDVKNFAQYHIKFMLTELPTPEDADVAQTLGDFKDYTKDILEMVVGCQDRTQALLTVSLISDLLGGSANLKSVQSFLNHLNDYIDSHFPENTQQVQVPKEEVGAGGSQQPQEEWDAEVMNETFPEPQEVENPEEVSANNAPNNAGGAQYEKAAEAIPPSTNVNLT